MKQVLGEATDFGMGLGIHDSPSCDRPLAGRGEPIASDQARATTGIVADRRLLSLGMMVLRPSGFGDCPRLHEHTSMTVRWFRYPPGSNEHFAMRAARRTLVKRS
jgi:hypothetical protein